MRYEQLGGETVQEGPESVGGKFEVQLADVPYLLGDRLDAKLDEIAQEIMRRKNEAFQKKFEESCDKAGTAMDAHGQPLSAELILQMMSTVDMEFGPDGKPVQTIVIHPSMAPALRKAAEEFENDPELQRRHAEILERQRNAWSVRENNRRLVD